MPPAGTLRDAFVNRFAPLGLNISVNMAAGQQPQIWADVQTTLADRARRSIDALVGQDGGRSCRHCGATTCRRSTTGKSYWPRLIRWWPTAQ